MGDFQNVTVGNGEISLDGVDIGFIKGDVSVSRTVETLDCLTGIPLQVQGRVIIQEQFSITIPVSEITGPNIANISLNLENTVIPGTPVTVDPGDNQERTFSAASGASIETIRLDGPSVTTLVVQNQDESTTYVADTDYILDATAGVVYRSPSGSITSGEVVRVSYIYTPPASNRINLGNNRPIETKELLFTHISPVSGRIITIFMPAAQFSGELDLNFQEREFATISAEAIGTPDDNFPDARTGHIDIAEAPMAA